MPLLAVITGDLVDSTRVSEPAAFRASIELKSFAVSVFFIRAPFDSFFPDYNHTTNFW